MLAFAESISSLCIILRVNRGINVLMLALIITVFVCIGK